jgi:cell division septum initiation protein DivIVA
MPTTLEEAIHIIHQLQAENAELKQQIADLTAQRDEVEQKKAPPPVKPAGAEACAEATAQTCPAP